MLDKQKTEQYRRYACKWTIWIQNNKLHHKYNRNK